MGEGLPCSRCDRETRGVAGEARKEGAEGVDSGWEGCRSWSGGPRGGLARGGSGGCWSAGGGRGAGSSGMVRVACTEQAGKVLEVEASHAIAECACYGFELQMSGKGI